MWSEGAKRGVSVDQGYAGGYKGIGNKTASVHLRRGPRVLMRLNEALSLLAHHRSGRQCGKRGRRGLFVDR